MSLSYALLSPSSAIVEELCYATATTAAFACKSPLCFVAPLDKSICDLITMIYECGKQTRFTIFSGLKGGLWRQLRRAALFFAARNSQLMGRDRQFAERFANVLVAFNAIECAECEPYVPRTTNPDALNAADKMARLVEVLFFVTKNRKSRLRTTFALGRPILAQCARALAEVARQRAALK